MPMVDVKYRGCVVTSVRSRRLLWEYGKRKSNKKQELFHSSTQLKMKPGQRQLAMGSRRGIYASVLGFVRPTDSSRVMLGTGEYGVGGAAGEDDRSGGNMESCLSIVSLNFALSSSLLLLTRSSSFRMSALLPSPLSGLLVSCLACSSYFPSCGRRRASPLRFLNSASASRALRRCTSAWPPYVQLAGTLRHHAQARQKRLLPRVGKLCRAGRVPDRLRRSLDLPSGKADMGEAIGAANEEILHCRVAGVCRLPGVELHVVRAGRLRDVGICIPRDSVHVVRSQPRDGKVYFGRGQRPGDLVSVAPQTDILAAAQPEGDEVTEVVHTRVQAELRIHADVMRHLKSGPKA
eukprot:scaffold7352_cov254-Pinguiococcus_pyrenoidosus.AAC.36